MAGVNPVGKRALQANQSVENYRRDGNQFQPLTDKNANSKKIDFGKLYGDENSGASTFPNVKYYYNSAFKYT